jgi:ERCC4-type nuclease
MEAFEGRRVVIIEGGLLAEPDNRVGLAKRLRARSRLQHARGITVVETIGMRGTAYEILLAIHDSAEAQAKTAPMPAAAKSDTPYDVSIAMLRVVRGISLARAEALVARYNDLASVGSAHPSEVAEVANMPEQIAEALYEALNGRPAAARKPSLRVVGRS